MRVKCGKCKKEFEKQIPSDGKISCPNCRIVLKVNKRTESSTSRKSYDEDNDGSFLEGVAADALAAAILIDSDDSSSSSSDYDSGGGGGSSGDWDD